jgi:hypothetical protein
MVLLAYADTALDMLAAEWEVVLISKGVITTASARGFVSSCCDIARTTKENNSQKESCAHQYVIRVQIYAALVLLTDFVKRKSMYNSRPLYF